MEVKQGSVEFFGKIIDILEETLRIGEEKEKFFNYLGVSIESTKEKVTMDQEGYIKRMDIPDKRLYRGQRLLDKGEMTKYRSDVGKLNWLGQQTRPDITIEASYLSQDTEDTRRLIRGSVAV